MGFRLDYRTGLLTVFLHLETRWGFQTETPMGTLTVKHLGFPLKDYPTGIRWATRLGNLMGWQTVFLLTASQRENHLDCHSGYRMDLR